MPIYEYRCKSCEARFSRLQRVGAGADGLRCPECESEKVDRLLSTFASASSSETVGCPAASSCSSGFT
ncbi:MAG: zinc ribbon domain-containing protein [Thermoanaerobaculales bacterium]